MTRREARKEAFCLLFEQAVSGEAVEVIIQAANEARDLAPDPFSEALAYGAEEHLPELDLLITENLKGWSLRRLSKVALSLLRMAVFELMYQRDTPVSVIINEAVELAKTYGGQGDSAYVNGVLGSVARTYRPQERSSAPSGKEPEKA